MRPSWRWLQLADRRAIALAIAAAIAIPAEGLRQWAYRDPPGILSVCYGATRNVEVGRKYSEGECLRRLEGDMGDAVDTVDRCVPGLPVEVLAAFADAVYNIGPRVACDKGQSTAARMLAAGELVAACNQLPRWDKSRVAGVYVALPGLTKRRAEELDLCLQGAG